MTRAELNAIFSLIGLAGVFWWFQMRMLDGVTIVDQPASKLFWIYLVVIAVATIVEILIASGVALVFGKKSAGKDERDHAIEARAGQFERYFIIVAINVLLWQALMEGLMDGHALPRIDLTSLPTLFFALFSVLFAGEMVRRIATLVFYRLQSARG